VRFDLNDYSVPASYVKRTVTVLASTDTVRIIDGASVIATHPRSYDRKKTVENHEHIEQLKARKRQAGQHRRTHILHELAPSSIELLRQVAERNQSLHHATLQIKALLDAYGAPMLEAAIKEALDAGAPHPQAVRHILERSRAEAGKAPALPIPLPDDPRLQNLTLKPNSLTAYDNLMEDDDND
jgi:hypothetical protein